MGGTLLMINKNVRKKKPVDKATTEVDRVVPGPSRAKEYASREIKLHSEFSQYLSQVHLFTEPTLMIRWIK